MVFNDNEPPIDVPKIASTKDSVTKMRDLLLGDGKAQT